MNEDKMKSMMKQIREGKRIIDVARENDEDYWEVYFMALNNGERSSMGIKRMIGNRLRKLREHDEELVAEVEDLVQYIYDRWVENQNMLDAIRKIMQP